MEIKDLPKNNEKIIQEGPGLYIWRANSSIKKSLHHKQKEIYIVLDFSNLLEIREKHPKEYIEILKIYQHALMNQIYYMIDGNKVEIACSQIKDETPMWYLYSLEYREYEEKGYLYIENIETLETLKKSKWLSIKAMNRNISRKNKLLAKKETKTK